jgi:uncharacterized membrane protein
MATHTTLLDDGPQGYHIFKDKIDGCRVHPVNTGDSAAAPLPSVHGLEPPLPADVTRPKCRARAYGDCYKEVAMSTVTESVDVHVPVHTAYNQWTQFESFPQFMGGVESVRQLDDRHTHWVTQIGGVRREFDAEITEQHPDERIAWQSTGGKTKHAGVVSFQPIGEQDTRVTVQLDWEPESIAEKAGSAARVDVRQVKADTRRFKEFIEQRSDATGAWRGDIAGSDR